MDLVGGSESSKEVSPTRPKIITAAVILFFLGSALNDVVRICEFGIPLRLTNFLATFIVWGPTLLVSVAVYRGKNWARVLIAGLTALGICYLPWSLHYVRVTNREAMLTAQSILHAVASVLLFNPIANSWFRSRTLFKFSKTVK